MDSSFEAGCEFCVKVVKLFAENLPPDMSAAEALRQVAELLMPDVDE